MLSRIASLFLALPILASACDASVELGFSGVGPGGGVSATLSSGGSTVSGKVGQLLFNTQNQIGSTDLGSVTAGGLQSQLMTFCIEIGQHVSNSWSVFDTGDAGFASTTHTPGSAVTATIGLLRASALDLLADNFWQAATTGTLVEAAAFQLSVWEIVHESPSAALGNPLGSVLDVSLGEGSFFVANTSPGTVLQNAITTANGWLSQISAYLDNDVSTVSTLTSNNSLSLLALTSNTRQNQIVQYVDTELSPEVAANPEPVSAIVWGGVIGLCALRRRSRG